MYTTALVTIVNKVFKAILYKFPNCRSVVVLQVIYFAIIIKYIFISTNLLYLACFRTPTQRISASKALSIMFYLEK